MFPHLFIIFSMICYFDFLIIKVLETLNEFFFSIQFWLRQFYFIHLFCMSNKRS